MGINNWWEDASDYGTYRIGTFWEPKKISVVGTDFRQVGLTATGNKQHLQTLLGLDNGPLKR